MASSKHQEKVHPSHHINFFYFKILKLSNNKNTNCTFYKPQEQQKTKNKKNKTKKKTNQKINKNLAP